MAYVGQVTFRARRPGLSVGQSWAVSAGRSVRCRAEHGCDPPRLLPCYPYSCGYAGYGYYPGYGAYYPSYGYYQGYAYPSYGYGYYPSYSYYPTYGYYPTYPVYP